MSASDAQLDLKKRARRRLVGAAALAIIAAAVLPMVMDHEPRQAAQDIEIRIPNPEQGTLTSHVAPAPDAGDTAIPPPEAATPVVPAPDKAPKAEPAPKAAETKEAKPGGAEPAKMPAPENALEKPPATPKLSETATPAAKEPAAKVEWVVQLGAFSDSANVNKIRARVKAQGYNVFTEKLSGANGTRTRVRAGPFASREAAEQAKAKLALGGLSGIVAER